jgi:hypothetical protein
VVDGQRRFAPGTEEHDAQDHDRDRQMNGVESGQREVGQHEQLDLGWPRAGVPPVEPRHQAFVEVVGVLQPLQGHEHQAEHGRDRQKPEQRTPMAESGRVDRQGHAGAADQQHDRVDATQRQIHVSAALGKAERIQRPIDGVGGEQAAEEHQLGGQKDPHAQMGGGVLLFERVEVGRQRWALVAGNGHAGRVG